MPEFGSPFSGLAKERKVTKEELIRARRKSACWRVFEIIEATCS